MRPNRVEQMKIFRDHWDMDLIYREAEMRGIAPAYKPLDDAETSHYEHDKEASPEGRRLPSNLINVCPTGLVHLSMHGGQRLVQMIHCKRIDR